MRYTSSYGKAAFAVDNVKALRRKGRRGEAGNGRAGNKEKPQMTQPGVAGTKQTGHELATRSTKGAKKRQEAKHR